MKIVNQSHYRPEVPRGFQEVEVLRLSDNGPCIGYTRVYMDVGGGNGA